MPRDTDLDPDRPRPSDHFNEWPASAQEAYLEVRHRVHRMKAMRDALRTKQAAGGLTEDEETASDAELTGTALSLEELTLPWERWMDGRIHRLKHGRDFHGNLSAVIEEGRLAARITGRGALQLREQIGPKYQYVWVQFADYAVLIGDPCPCGGRRLARLHPNLARCKRCGKTMTLRPR